MLVKRAVAAHADLGHARRQSGHRLLDHPAVARAGGDVAVAELVSQHHVLLGPQRHHRLVAGPPVIGRQGGLLLTRQNGRIDIDRRPCLWRPLLEPGDQPPAARGQALQPLTFRQYRAALALPQGWRRLVERLEKIPYRLGCRDRIPEQQRQSRVLAQLCQIFAALAAGRP